jgi:hypothetical protein
MLAHAWNFDKHVPTDYGESNMIHVQSCKNLSSMSFVFILLHQFGLKSLTECETLWIFRSRASAINRRTRFFRRWLSCDAGWGNCLQDEGSSTTVSIARRQNGGELADLDLAI